MPLNQTDLSKIQKIVDKKLANYPTKKDLAKQLSAYPTKLDLTKQLSAYPTKKDLVKQLSAYPTKKDLARELSIYATRLDLQEVKIELEEKIKNLPSRKEFYNSMDKLMAELKNIRESHKIYAYRVSDHEERLNRIESRLQLAV